jgi:TolB protein
MTSSVYIDPFEGSSDIANLEEIGDSGQAAAHSTGAYQFDPEQQSYTITAGGAGSPSGLEGCHFVWRPMSGDFILTAQAVFTGENSGPRRQLGWMARASLDGASPAVIAALRGDGVAALRYRRESGGQIGETQAELPGADMIQLERQGSSFILSAARFGDPFTTLQVDDIQLDDQIYVGMFACSQADGSAEQAVFHNVRVVKPAGPGFDRSRDPFGSHLEILDLSSGLRQIIYSSAEVFEAPNWTRDGSALIYNSGGRLYRFDLETREHARLDTGSVVHNNNDHVISFDGSMLAISSHGGETFGSLIYTVPLAGGQPRQITPVGPSYLHGWSPDGRLLVYTALRSGQYDIYQIPAEGGLETQLTNTLSLDDGPEYSPDGEFIYFNSVRTGSMEIWRMRPDGSQPEQLTHDTCNNWFPHVSPDGQSVVFLSYLEGEVEPSDHPAAKRVYLRIMPRDGALKGPSPLVVAYLYGGQGTMNVPSWSPDGRRLAFVSNSVPY